MNGAEMNIGDRVRFHRPGATGSHVQWFGMIEAVDGSFYLIRDQSGRLRVVAQTEKWLMMMEDENEPIKDPLSTQTREC